MRPSVTNSDSNFMGSSESISRAVAAGPRLPVNGMSLDAQLDSSHPRSFCCAAAVGAPGRRGA